MITYLVLRGDEVVGHGACAREAFDALQIDPGDTAVPFDGAAPDFHRKWFFRQGALVDGGERFTPTYADMRRAAYPSIGDQMDALWHAMDTGVLPKAEPFYSDIKTVKTQYAKP